MANVLVAGHYYRLTCWNQCIEQAGLNVRYFRVTALSATPMYDDELADALATQLGPLYKALMAQEASFLGVVVQDESASPPTAAAYSTLEAGAGGVLGGPLPRQTCGIITVRSTLAGRANRGRIYVPFPGEEDNSGAGFPIPTASYVDRMEALGLALTGVRVVEKIDNPLITATVEYVIKPVGALLDPVPASDAVPRSRWATQRRRGSYGAANAPPF